MPSKYWNGTANWSSASNWYLDDAHLSGTTAPTLSDDVFFTINSTGTCTISATSNCLSLNMTGFAGGFAGAANLNIYGGSIFSGGTFTYNGDIGYNAASGSWQIYTNGKTLGSINFVGNNFNVGGSWTFMDSVTLGTNDNISLVLGSLDLNSQNFILPGGLRSNVTGNRTLTTGSAVVHVGGTYAWSLNPQNLTFNNGTETIYIWIKGQA